MMKIIGILLMLFAGNAVAADYKPTQATQNNKPADSTNTPTGNPPVAVSEIDESCAKASHKTHGHCPKPQGNIRHDGRVWRNGKIIKE